MRTSSFYLALMGLLLGGVANLAQADWFFRGTPNNWGVTALTATSSTTFETCQTFATAAGGARFKIDRLGNWAEAYPAADYMVTGNTTYRITFNSNTKAIGVQAVADCTKVFPSLYFRGTANAWGATPMTLVANNTWQLTVKLDGQANQAFKFDVLGNWSQNYGDTNGDKILDQSGNNINYAGTGDFKITVNDVTRTYSVQAVSCTTNCSSSSSSSSNSSKSSLSSLSSLSSKSSLSSASSVSKSSLSSSLSSKSSVSSLSSRSSASSRSSSPVITTLGAVYSPTSTAFSLWSPDSSNVKVKVNGVLHSMQKVADFNGYTGIYQAVIEGDLHLAEYNFLVNDIDVRDPYGKMAKPGTNSNIVMDMSRTNLTGGWAARPGLVAREDAIIYEVHIRDFTIDTSSGVSADKRGKFLGMVQGGTTFNGVKTGIDHLKELGVTHVHLLPVYDFSTCENVSDSDPCYNWGYDPRNYNVPEERYSQTPLDYENRAREFKTLVNEFHKAGIRVVMDVVYNHSYAKEMFNPITSKYYTATDLSGTGNSIDADQPMVSRMIQDSLEYWAEEYGLDGFRFDLMGIFSYAEVEKWGRHLNTKFADRNLLVYGEPWAANTDPKEAQRVRFSTTRFMAEEHIGVFNGAYRDAIKGNNDGTTKGYMFNNTAVADAGWAIYDGMRGSPYNANDSRNGTWFRNFTADPEQTINYISVHDNYALWDKIYLSLSSNVVQNSAHQIQSLTPPGDLGYGKRIVNFGMGMVLTSQGIPLIHAGDEFLRSKTSGQQMNLVSAWNYGTAAGAHNSYNAPDSFNSIKWQNKIDNAATFKYFKELVNLRRTHAGLRMNTNAEIAQYLAPGVPADFGGQVITGLITSPKDNYDLFVVYNSGNNSYVNLPAGVWTQVANTQGATNITGVSAMALVEGTAVTVFRKPR